MCNFVKKWPIKHKKLQPTLFFSKFSRIRIEYLPRINLWPFPLLPRRIFRVELKFSRPPNGIFSISKIDILVSRERYMLFRMIFGKIRSFVKKNSDNPRMFTAACDHFAATSV